MTQGYKSWSYGMTDVSISKVNMFKNSSTPAVSVLINLSIKFGFVLVNGPMLYRMSYLDPDSVSDKF